MGFFPIPQYLTATSGRSPVHPFGARARRALHRYVISFSVSLTDFLPGLTLNIRGSARRCSVAFPLNREAVPLDGVKRVAPAASGLSSVVILFFD